MNTLAVCFQFWPLDLWPVQVLTLLINSAYKPSRVLRELQLDQEGRWQGHGETLKAKWVDCALRPGYTSFYTFCSVSLTVVFTQLSKYTQPQISTDGCIRHMRHTIAFFFMLFQTSEGRTVRLLEGHCPADFSTSFGAGWSKTESGHPWCSGLVEVLYRQAWEHLKAKWSWTHQWWCCLCVCVDGGECKESEQVNSTQAFYQLQGLNPGVWYNLKILSTNISWAFKTNGPGTSQSQVSLDGFMGSMLSSAVCRLFLRAARVAQ